ncbi:MAG: hypothetical protein WCK89_23435, partial [bacterium]
YTVQMRDAWGNVGKASAAKAAVARDDTPPARYRVGEWRTRPLSTLSNTVVMKAMSVTGEEECPKIEAQPVEYFFHCASGKGPDSGWIKTAAWQTPALPDGTYSYRFKMRDTSPQQNETPDSAAETVVVSPLTGYHDCPVKRLAQQADGVLVVFKGKVTAVEADAYTVSAEGASIQVVPHAAACATDAALKDREVAVRGCVWLRNGKKCVVWAEVK